MQRNCKEIKSELNQRQLKMIKLKIDNKEISVPKGTSILEAAKELGIHIPSMCYLKGYGNHPSCMLCMVKDKKTGQLHPSCAYPAQEGLEIITNDAEVRESRKDALELLLSDHVGDCEAPCRIACPAFMDIPEMNRLIAAGKSIEALKLVKEEIALPLVLGYVCSAPCENACRRKAIDNPVSICQLKKHVALADANSDTAYLPEKEISTGKKIAIIGAGVAGLSAAFHLTKSGFACTVFDKNEKAGGALLNTDQPKELPSEVLEKEISILEKFGIEFQLNKNIDSKSLVQLKLDYGAVIIASGEFNADLKESFGLKLNAKNTGFEVVDGFFTTSEANVFVCGSAIKVQKMAVRALSQGKAAAYFISNLLKSGEEKVEYRMFNSKFGKLQTEEYSEYLKEAISDNRFEPDKELDGFANEMAIEEAKRCLRCDCRKPKTCKLRIYADEYGAKQKQYQFGERKLVQKIYTHETIVYEVEKCIRCGLCVDITQKEKELTGLTYIGRGFDVRIGIPFNESLQKSLEKTAIKCAESCPTGAISLKY
ncbi:MAG: FAD-dependent oxidoreductase [Salinivirgaceae bacterium]|nr:FAD-dependent oxidoreductase [Salinivirgaceae bacterium]